MQKKQKIKALTSYATKIQALAKRFELAALKQQIVLNASAYILLNATKFKAFSFTRFAHSLRIRVSIKKPLKGALYQEIPQLRCAAFGMTNCKNKLAIRNKLRRCFKPLKQCTVQVVLYIFLVDVQAGIIRSRKLIHGFGKDGFAQRA